MLDYMPLVMLVKLKSPVVYADEDSACIGLVACSPPATDSPRNANFPLVFSLHSLHMHCFFAVSGITFHVL